jgi:hypothetical protein
MAISEVCAVSEVLCSVSDGHYTESSNCSVFDEEKGRCALATRISYMRKGRCALTRHVSHMQKGRHVLSRHVSYLVQMDNSV